MIDTLLPPQIYFSIGEVSEKTQVRAYVIRYWESQFGALRPSRRESGQRKFTQKDIDIILRIKELLYQRGFTIAGAKRALRESRSGGGQLPLEFAESANRALWLDSLKGARRELEDALRLLKN